MKPTPDQLRALATLFEQVLRHNKNYFRLRLVPADHYGLEQVRVDRADDGLINVHGDDLQERVISPPFQVPCAWRPGRPTYRRSLSTTSWAPTQGWNNPR